MTVFSLLSFKKKKQALCVPKPLHVVTVKERSALIYNIKGLKKPKTIHCLESNSKSVFKAKVPQSDPCVL